MHALDEPRPRLPIRRPAAYAGVVEPAVSALYAELRSLAHGMMRRERGGHTLQTTGLVHEAWMRLGQDGQWDSRHHFLGAAAHAMRRILVEYARARGRDKRGGGAQVVSLDTAADATIAELYGQAVDLLALDDALDRLAARSELGARIIELRFFAGMSHQEIATACGVSLRTVERSFRFARAYLHQALSEPEPNPDAKPTEDP
jgi:RNA polymerase sigma factor (TIGR02999 family)